MSFSFHLASPSVVQVKRMKEPTRYLLDRIETSKTTILRCFFPKMTHQAMKQGPRASRGRRRMDMA